MDEWRTMDGAEDYIGRAGNGNGREFTCAAIDGT